MNIHQARFVYVFGDNPGHLHGRSHNHNRDSRMTGHICNRRYGLYLALVVSRAGVECYRTVCSFHLAPVAQDGACGCGDLSPSSVVISVILLHLVTD